MLLSSTTKFHGSDEGMQNTTTHIANALLSVYIFFFVVLRWPENDYCGNKLNEINENAQNNAPTRDNVLKKRPSDQNLSDKQYISVAFPNNKKQKRYYSQ